MAELNIDALTAEVDSLSEADLRAFVLKEKVRSKVATAKYYNADKARELRQKKAAKLKEAIARLKALGIYDQIETEAKAKAAEQLEDEGEAAVPDEELAEV